MKLDRDPELLDRLAAQYALGVLRGRARSRLEHLARTEPAIQAAVGHWQARLAGIAELQPSATPVDKVWCGIEDRLGWKAPAPSRWQRFWRARLAAPAFWRGTAAALALVAALALGLDLWLARQLATAPPAASAIAVLHDAQAQPAMLVTLDARAGELTVRRLDHLALDPTQALQLWALPAGGKPQSLGVLGQRREARLALPPALGRPPALAVSIEPPTGSPDPAGPSGPVIFQGQVIDNTL